MLNEFKNDELTIDEFNELFDILSADPHLKETRHDHDDQQIYRSQLSLTRKTNYLYGDRFWCLIFNQDGCGVAVDTTFIDPNLIKEFIERVK